MPPDEIVRYSVDTSVLLNAWWRSYPPDLFPTLWQNVDELVTAGVLVASEEVLVELEKKDDEVYGWAKERPAMFIPIDTQVQEVVATILESYPRLIDNRPNRSGADPFVIALAAVHGYTVLTQEGSGSQTRPRIPDVCAARGIRCISLVDCIREQGWRI